MLYDILRIFETFPYTSRLPGGQNAEHPCLLICRELLSPDVKATLYLCLYYHFKESYSACLFEVLSKQVNQLLVPRRCFLPTLSKTGRVFLNLSRGGRVVWAQPFSGLIEPIWLLRLSPLVPC